ncbi:MAG: helix-turn-helix transcriptional regulator [Acidimicrobiia bacterium]
MDTELFDQQVGDLAASLGDATRRGIYVSVREAPESVTANEIATVFGIHANVARHHLDKLVTDGYLRVTHRRRGGRRGPGAGRPAKHYETTAKEVSVQFPERRYDLLSELLMRVVERVAPDTAAAVAEEVGREYGRELAAEIGIPADAGFDAAVQAVARAMMGMGFDTAANAEERMLLTKFCPFGQTATDHPEVVCRLDEGIVRGLLEAAKQQPVAIVTPHLASDEECVTDV